MKAWLLLFGSSRFAGSTGVPSVHLADLMIKGSWSQIHEDEFCSSGFTTGLSNDIFGFEIGLSDYEDDFNNNINRDNDIAMRVAGTGLFNRRFTNIDAFNIGAADKVMAEYQVPEGGDLTGRVIEVSLVRGSVSRLTGNFYMDPDDACRERAQADIDYREWIANLRVSSLGVDEDVSLYVNADEAEFLWGQEILNIVWEDPGAPEIDDDKFRVFYFDVEVLDVSGNWIGVDEFVVDWRVPENQWVVDEQGRFRGGFRRSSYDEKPALEASFGFGHRDYVIDSDPTARETLATLGRLNLLPVPPSAPVITRVDTLDSELLVSFDLIDDGGASISGFTVTCESEQGTVSVHGATSPLALTGLENGLSYQCYVVAANTAGVSPISELSEMVSPQAFSTGLPVWLLFQSKQER